MVARPGIRIIPPKKLHPSKLLPLPDPAMGLLVDDEVLLEAAGVIVAVFGDDVDVDTFIAELGAVVVASLFLVSVVDVVVVAVVRVVMVTGLVVVMVEVGAFEAFDVVVTLTA